MRLKFLLAAALALSLDACGWLPKQSEFDRVGEGRSLEVPPDLDEPDTSAALRIPNATYSAVRGGFVDEPQSEPARQRARFIEHEGAQALALDQALDVAWRQVGIALERNGLDVDESNQADRLYRVVYVDRKAKQERPGRFSRWILRRKGPPDHSGTYQLRLKALYESVTLIQLFDAAGGPPPAPVKDEVLGALRNSLG